MEAEAEAYTNIDTAAEEDMNRDTDKDEDMNMHTPLGTLGSSSSYADLHFPFLTKKGRKKISNTNNAL